MVPSALPVVATVPPSFGTWAQRRPSPSTLWTLVTRSMLFPSHQTATGSVPPLAPSSRSGIWSRRSLSRSLSPRLWDTRRVHHQSALHSAGHLMDRPSLPDTLTTSSVSGLFCPTCLGIKNLLLFLC